MKKWWMGWFLAASLLSAGCGGGCYLATVVGLNPYGDNFLAVRSGPGSRYTMFDQLHTGDRVIVCGSRGRWKRIFYGRGGYCALRYGEPVGQCVRGWAYGKYLMPY
jgi:hypothetical protein